MQFSRSTCTPHTLVSSHTVLSHPTSPSTFPSRLLSRSSSNKARRLTSQIVLSILALFTVIALNGASAAAATPTQGYVATQSIQHSESAQPAVRPKAPRIPGMEGDIAEQWAYALPRYTPDFAYRLITRATDHWARLAPRLWPYIKQAIQYAENHGHSEFVEELENWGLISHRR